MPSVEAVDAQERGVEVPPRYSIVCMGAQHLVAPLVNGMPCLKISDIVTCRGWSCMLFCMPTMSLEASKTSPSC